MTIEPQRTIPQVIDSAQIREPDIFVHNISAVFGDFAVGREANKVHEIEMRAGWLNREGIVVSELPDPDFTEYMATFGVTPEIIAPAGLNRDRLTLSDGFNDPRLQAAINGKTVEMYMGDRRWYEFVTAHGGVYFGGDPGDSVERVNDKVLFQQEIADGITAFPPGQVAEGIDEVVTVLYALLSVEGRAILRLARGGGGLGNTKINQPMSKTELRKLLLDRHPSLEDSGTRALVETFLPDLQWSPSVSHHTEQGHISDGLQATIGTEYVGRISPTPSEVYDGDKLAEVSAKILEGLRRLGFRGYANTDLGVSQAGVLYGFEENGRTGAARHADEVGQMQMGPITEWRENDCVYISRDEFFLRRPASFHELHEALAKERLLSKPGEPNGAVIIIPPAGRIAGIQVHAQGRGKRSGYQIAHELFERVIDAVGDRQANKEDHPYAPR